MNSNLIVFERPEGTKILARDMSVGEIGYITNEAANCGYGGGILMREYDGFVNIANPQQSWQSDCTLVVIKFPPKSEIKIRVGIPEHLW